MTASDLLNLTSYATGAIISLLVALVPYIKRRFEPLDGRTKALLIFVVSVVAALALAVGACSYPLSWLPCDKSLYGKIATAAFVVWGSSQTAYLGIKNFKAQPEPPQ